MIQRQLAVETKCKAKRKVRGCSRAAKPDLGPNFYAPTVLADVTQDMRVMREETFGPVLSVAPFDSDDEAVRLANDSDFALAASVWTNNTNRGEALARRIVAGTVMVNDTISCFGISEAPHGGVKASGIGRSHGRFGLEEMVRVVPLAPRDRHQEALVVRLWRDIQQSNGSLRRLPIRAKTLSPRASGSEVGWCFKKPQALSALIL